MRFYFVMILILVSVLSVPLLSQAQSSRLTLELGDLPSRASSVVDITIDKSTLDWALQAKKFKGMNADEVRDLMKELESFTVKVLDFKEAEKAPNWDDLLSAARKALNELDGPRWQSIVSVTERKKDSPAMVRISFLKPVAGANGGMAILVVEPKTLVLINMIGNVSLDKLTQIGKALGQPGLLEGLGGKSSPKSK
jgi:hypothetical protein